MKTLILSSSFTTYETDAHGNRKARIIDNDNGFLDKRVDYDIVVDNTYNYE